MKYISSFLVILLFIVTNISAQDGGELFKKHCKACHTIGEGIKVGPDLTGISSKRSFDWLVKFVKSSKDVIASGDKDAVAIFEEYEKKPMPNHSNSVAEIQVMFDYIAGGGDQSAENDTDTKSESSIFVPDAGLGKKMFTGEQSLKNGGPSCISCHNIRHNDVSFGGFMAMDLSISYKEGVVESMETSMPSMINSYKNSPLTVEERVSLDLFLKETKENQLYQAPGQFKGMFFFFGAVFCIIILIIINLFWKNNKTKGVKDEIFKRQIKNT